jgi:hypothetical protein
MLEASAGGRFTRALVILVFVLNHFYICNFFIYTIPHSTEHTESRYLLTENGRNSYDLYFLILLTSSRLFLFFIFFSSSLFVFIMIFLILFTNTKLILRSKNVDVLNKFFSFPSFHTVHFVVRFTPSLRRVEPKYFSFFTLRIFVFLSLDNFTVISGSF